MSDFLLELRSEEIPARMQVQANADLARLFAAELAKHGLAAGAVETFATPRRLALIARDLPDATEALSEELKGPRTSAPEQALDGFLRKTGLTRAALTERDGVWFAALDKPGRPTSDVLSEAIPAIIRAFPWPKSMRWGAASLSTESLRWVRPLQGIVALLGETIVPCEIDGITSGAATLGHRFVHPGPITIGGAHDYVEKLRACHVIVDFSERCAIIREGARAAAEAAGLTLIEDEGLVAENAGLTEWPVPLLGRFDAGYLAVPQEIIQLTARVNQKYFVCSSPLPAGERVDSPQASGERALESPLPDAARLSLSPEGRGDLANAFVCTANIDAPDGGSAIVDGNRKVIASRLADAKFFWENDVQVRLETQAQKLSGIVFHEKLGTVADKVERVAKLARWLCEEGIVRAESAQPNTVLPEPVEGLPFPLSGNSGEGKGGLRQAQPSRIVGGGTLADLAERAARLCKADLVTGTVGEFPELQGVIGGHLARAQGEDDAVADAIRDHYKPIGQGDDVPTAPVTMAVSLADKLDTIASFFGAGMPPTGSKDPFALRRAALGILAIIIDNQLRLNLETLVKHAQMWILYSGKGLAGSRDELMAFFADRLKVQQREAGVRHDLIDAVFALGGEDDLVRLLARVCALQAFVETAEGMDLLAGYKRAANILKKDGYASSTEVVTPAEERRVGSSPGRSLDTRDVSNPTLVHLPNSSPVEITELDSRLRGNDEVGGLDAEEYLRRSLDVVEPRAVSAIEAENFGDAMTALASLRAPIDTFFTSVMVNDPDPAIRARRLGLLARFRDAVHTVADFSKIEG